MSDPTSARPVVPLVGGEGITRTDMHCHNCSKTFIAQFDFSLNGNHVVHCPHCGHEHFRVVKDGTITGERWDDAQPVHCAASTWCSPKLQTTTTAALFLRDLWLRGTA